MRDTDSDFQQLNDEAFEKHKQPVGLKASLRESIGVRASKKKTR